MTMGTYTAIASERIFGVVDSVEGDIGSVWPEESRHVDSRMAMNAKIVVAVGMEADPLEHRAFDVKGKADDLSAWIESV